MFHGFCLFACLFLVGLLVFMVPACWQQKPRKRSQLTTAYAFLRAPFFLVLHLSDTAQNLLPALEESSCHLHSFIIMGPLLSSWNSCLGVPLPCSKHEGPSRHMGSWFKTLCQGIKHTHREAFPPRPSKSWGLVRVALFSPSFCSLTFKYIYKAYLFRAQMTESQECRTSRNNLAKIPLLSLYDPLWNEM